MSLIRFDLNELANLAGCAVGGPLASDCGKRALRDYSEALSLYSSANSRCYGYTYGGCSPVTIAGEFYSADELEKRAPKLALSRGAAVRTARLLRYNLIANDGTDFSAEPEYKDVLHGIVSVLVAMLPDPGHVTPVQAHGAISIMDMIGGAE